MSYNQLVIADEIIKASKTLKNGKFTAKDLISNEIIKYGIPILVDPYY